MAPRRGWLVLTVLGLALSLRATAEPSFARTYHADCTLCHTIYPRLNRTGYEFRRHGYRFVTAPPAAAPGETVRSSTPLGSRSVLAGKDLIVRRNCQTCHSIAGQGGRIGPTLDGVALRRSAEYISAQIADPKQHNRSSIMPASHLTRGELQEIVAFLTSLPGPDSVKVQKGEPKLLDYLGATYEPAIRVSQTGGALDANYDTRELTLFAAGTLGPYFSMFVESVPTTDQTGFAQKWGEAQGVFTTTGASDYAQIRTGQLLMLQGAGFGATDRVISDSFPLIYFPVNGFAAARFVRGVSGEYTFAEGTTLKLFGGESSDHSRSNGAVLEQVIGRSGLSGFSVAFADGWNPVLRNDPTAPELRFRRLLLAGNKAFQDSQNRERLNLIAAVAFGDDNHLVGGDPARANRSYGSYVEVETAPVPRHLGAYFRLDQLRPTTQQAGSMRAKTAGVTVDLTHYARLLLEYQRFDFSGGNNFYTIGFRLNF